MTKSQQLTSPPREPSAISDALPVDAIANQKARAALPPIATFTSTVDGAERPSTVAELLLTILADAELTDTRRRNVASSIRRFCKVLNLNPADAPAAFWFFREKLERFHPRKAYMTEHRWQTIRSDVAFALKRVGLSPDQPKPRAKLSAVWIEFQNAARVFGLRRWPMHAFVRFCDGRGIAPADVVDPVVAEYEDYLTQQTFKTKPGRNVRDLCQLWNRLASDHPHLGLNVLAIRSNRDLYTPAWDDVPEPLRDEVDAWLTSMSSAGDLLSETGPNRPLRPASLKTYRYALLQTIAGVMHSGTPLEGITSLSSLVEPSAAKAALRFHLDRNKGEPSQMLSQIAHALVLVQQYIIGTAEPTVAVERQLAHLRQYRAKLMPKHRGVNPKPRQALRQFADRDNIEKLLMMPLRIYRRLQRANELDAGDARPMQVAVALELLLMRPIRRGNLVNLRLGEHLLRAGNGMIIVLQEHEVKNGVAHEYPIPPESAQLIDFYIKRLLPLLRGTADGFLFPGEDPTRPKSAEQLGRNFKKVILEETGIDVYPHLLRHFAANLYITEHPEGLEVVRRVLGHRSVETTNRAYTEIHDRVAVGEYDKVVLGIRSAILKEIGDA